MNRLLPGVGWNCFYSRGSEESVSIRGQDILHLISGFRHEVDEICAVLGYYVAYSGNSLPTFRDNVSVPSSRVKESKNGFLTIEYWDL